MTPYLFVYGTLMQNHDNPYTELIQSNSSLIGKGYIHALKYNLGDYPGIKLCHNKEHKTTGELYQINTNIKQVITELDFYEGYYPENTSQSLFIRKEATVISETHEEILAWVYEYARKIEF